MECIIQCRSHGDLGPVAYTIYGPVLHLLCAGNIKAKQPTHTLEELVWNMEPELMVIQERICSNEMPEQYSAMSGCRRKHFQHHLLQLKHITYF
jgi:hypothetical protein